MTKAPVRALVVDDSVVYRRIVRDVLATLPGIEVIGTAPNGSIALRKIELLQPDLLTLDLEMPEMDGLEVLRRLKRSGSQVGVIILSGVGEHGAKTTMTALELGVFDFVAKPTSGTSEENTVTLQEGLRPRVDAFARTRHVHKVLHSRQPPPVAMPALQSVDENDVVHRMRRIVGETTGRAEVVAVGISTGGPQALNRVLPRLPADLPVPVLIVQHMPPVFTKSLAEDLDKRCKLTVSEAVNGQPVTPSQVLIAPGGKQMKVVKEEGLATIRITDDPPENSCRPSADYLFRSVTRAYGPNAVGVIMTGMGNDGVQGCRQMKQRGATIIAQNEASCVVFGMPREPVEEGLADVVAPPDEIAVEIVRLARQGATDPVVL